MRRTVKHVLLTALGWVFLVVGIAGLFLPVLQGILFIVIGLLLLAREYHWARRWLDRLRERFPAVFEHAERAAHRLRARFAGAPQRVLVATSNLGKLRDFRAAARHRGMEVEALPGLASLPAPAEDQSSFEANACQKAEHYGRLAPGYLVLADDSGLEVEALASAPGVRSARYAAEEPSFARPPGRDVRAHPDSVDEANNRRLLRELDNVPDEQRGARFVCLIAAARDGKTLATFRGEAQGRILREARGHNGFGYDPLFYFPALEATFAELEPEEKARVSHRGEAFRKFLEWRERT